MSDYRNVWALIAAVGLLQIAGGILGVITPLGLEAIGVDPFSIGMIAALYGAGFMAGAWLAPRLVLQIGNIRVFSAAAAVNAATTLVMGMEQSAWAWTPIRFLQGVAFAWMFASVESWLSAVTPAHARGGVTGFYHVIAKAALLAGPFLIAGLGPLEARPFFWAGIFLALALVPICVTSRMEPSRSGRSAMSPLAIMRIAPAAVWGVFLSGMINSGCMALLPVFSQTLATPESGMEPTSIAAIAMAAAWTGGLVSQWPAGRLSDRLDRRLVIAAMAVISAGAAVALGLFYQRLPHMAVFGLLALWGAGSLSFYGIAVAHGVDRAQQEQIGGLLAGLLFVWAAGSVIGPPLAGQSMNTPLGAGGLYIYVATLTVLLILAMLWRRGTRPAPGDAVKTDFSLPNQTSVPGAEIDPRSSVL